MASHHAGWNIPTSRSRGLDSIHTWQNGVYFISLVFYTLILIFLFPLSAFQNRKKCTLLNTVSFCFLTCYQRNYFYNYSALKPQTYSHGWLDKGDKEMREIKIVWNFPLKSLRIWTIAFHFMFITPNQLQLPCGLLGFFSPSISFTLHSTVRILFHKHRAHHANVQQIKSQWSSISYITSLPGSQRPTTTHQQATLIFLGLPSH